MDISNKIGCGKLAIGPECIHSSRKFDVLAYELFSSEGNHKSCLLYKYPDHTFGLDIRQATDNGVYSTFISSTDQNFYVYYTPTRGLYGNYFYTNLPVDAVKYNFVSCYMAHYPYSDYTKTKEKQYDIESKDVLKLYRKVFDMGLDRIFSLQNTPLNVDDVLERERQEEEEKLRKQKETAPVDVLSRLDVQSDVDLEKISEAISALKAIGIELAPEQQAKVDKLNRLNRFRLEADSREEAQRAARERIAEENARKEEWWSSPENPSNIHKEELNQMMAEAKKQSDTLDKVDNAGLRGILYDEQVKRMEDNKEFLRMMDKAEKHEDSMNETMDNEIRSWYQEYYFKQESSGKRM